MSPRPRPRLHSRLRAPSDAWASLRRGHDRKEPTEGRARLPLPVIALAALALLPARAPIAQARLRGARDRARAGRVHWQRDAIGVATGGHVGFPGRERPRGRPVAGPRALAVPGRRQPAGRRDLQHRRRVPRPRRQDDHGQRGRPRGGRPHRRRHERIVPSGPQAARMCGRLRPGLSIAPSVRSCRAAADRRMPALTQAA